MPQFRTAPLIATRDVSAERTLCDGCDPARPCDEHTPRASLWLLTRGAFELRDASGRHLIDPTQAIALPAHHAFQIRHPAGPDTCLSFRGPIVDALAACGARLVPVSPTQLARIVAALARSRRARSLEPLPRHPASATAARAEPEPRADGRPSSTQAEPDELEVAEALSELALRDEPGASGAPDRTLSAAVADTMRARFAEPTSLSELAATTGYSVFHTCRVFRATTGYTIHGFRRELRLRHALARILDGDESLSEIALATGFASQSHLTNLFRARFGITPARARTPAGQDALVRAPDSRRRAHYASSSSASSMMYGT
jgi:AraC-like DNA-binding protein